MVNVKQMINSILDRFQLGASTRNALNLLKYIFNWKLLLKNARFIRNGAPDGLPVQTPGLAFLVCGQYDLESMYYNGLRGISWITDLLKKNGLCIDEFDTILDFGCGCGRVLRFWKDLTHAKIYGTDYNPSLIRWCEDNLPFAIVSVNGLCFRTDYADKSFDMVYVISVFTHLSREMQSCCLDELIRITKPGGYIIITVHGVSRTSVLSDEELKRFRNGELVVRGGKYSGTNICGTYHPRHYLERLADGRLIEIDYLAQGATDADQDAYLFRKV
jgi:SAM-dependent methyltransferase